MSTTLNLAAMVTDIQNRIPMGLASAYIVDRLNEAFRWIAQQESFLWNLRRTTVAVDPGNVDFPLPSDADPGDVMSLYGSTFEYEIPFIPFIRFSQQGVWNRAPELGTFSAWTIVNNGTSYFGKLAPDTPLLVPATLNLFYHATVAVITNTALFFPSPDEFDSLIIDLAEAEIKRRYYLAGWEAVQQKATEQTKKLIDVYASSKKYIQGLADQARRTEEATLKRSE